MIRHFALTVLVLGLAGAATAGPPVDLIDDASWAAAPSGANMAAYYPSKALSPEAGGAVLLQCRARADGSLEKCTVLAEAPQKLGFGKAALNMAPYFRMKPLRGDGTAVTGKLIRVPLRWNLGEAKSPPLNYAVGQGANLVTIAAPRERGTFGCPSSKNADRQCTNHPVKWVESPGLDDGAAAILATGLTSGVSQLNCAAATDGALTDCRVIGEASPKTRDAMLSFVPTLKAPAAAIDGTPMTAGRLFIPFDWPVLDQAANAVSGN